MKTGAEGAEVHAMPLRQDERRTVFRVCVATTGATVEIDGQRGYTILDANSEGLGIGVRKRPTFKVGEMVSIRLTIDGESVGGWATVRNATRLPTGGLRYGLQLERDEIPLRRALRRLAVEAQREQLRRVAARRYAGRT